MVVQEGKLTSSYIETQKEHFILMIQGMDNGVFKECVFFGEGCSGLFVYEMG